jgi:hypothetical protein
LIRNLGMKYDYVLFHNSCNNNWCSFESRTCCLNMKSQKGGLGLFFENTSAFCKTQCLLQI